jgi:hypothetical protein
MPTYIKTGYWDKKAKAPDGWLDLNLFVQTIAPPAPPSTNIYNSDGTLTGNRTLTGNNNNLEFTSISQFRVNNAQYYDLDLNLNNIRLRSGGFNILLDYATNTGFFGRTDLPQQKLLEINLQNNYIKTIWNSNDIGLKLDFTNRVYEFGQINGSNATTLKIDDAAAFPVQVSGTNVTQNTSGTASGKFLKIKVDGVDYVIELKNPS